MTLRRRAGAYAFVGLLVVLALALATTRGEPVRPTQPYPRLGALDVRLAAAGDIGTGGDAAYATAAAMDALEADREFDAMLLLGDNVYPSGEAELVESRVLDPLASVLDGPTELVAALGNHDVRTGDGEPELAALGLSNRWYLRRFGPVAAVVVVDSTRAGDPDQLAWLDQTLPSLDAPWTVVIQHHPPYSAGRHGSDEAPRAHLVPRYERAGVDLVLSGHDHDYQRSVALNGVTYVISGGAATLRSTGREDFTVASASIYHFVELAAGSGQLDVRAVDQDGQVLDQFAIPD